MSRVPVLAALCTHNQIFEVKAAVSLLAPPEHREPRLTDVETSILKSSTEHPEPAIESFLTMLAVSFEKYTQTPPHFPI
jgi:hypothetical protein